MLYKCFLPNLTHVITLPCETQMFLLHHVEMYHLQQTKYLTPELAHRKLSMVYLAQLLVVTTDGLKVVRIRAYMDTSAYTTTHFLHLSLVP